MPFKAVFNYKPTPWNGSDDIMISSPLIRLQLEQGVQNGCHSHKHPKQIGVCSTQSWNAVTLDRLGGVSLSLEIQWAVELNFELVLCGHYWFLLNQWVRITMAQILSSHKGRSFVVRVRENCFGVCYVPCPCNDQALYTRVTNWQGYDGIQTPVGDWIRCLVRLTPRNSEVLSSAIWGF